MPAKAGNDVYARHDTEQLNFSSKSQTREELEAENAQLKAQLKLSQLKTEGLETMINIAEETLNISIRKKSGAKRSK